MADFKLTVDGATYKVTADSAEAAHNALMGSLGKGAQAPTTPHQGGAGGTREAKLAGLEAIQPSVPAVKPPGTGWQGVGGELKGAAETAGTLLTGAAAPFAGALSSGINAIRGQGETDLAKNVQSAIYQPQSVAGQRNLRAIGDVIEESKIPPYIPMVGTAGRGAKTVPAPQLEKGVQDVQNVAGNIGAAGKAAARSVLPELDPQLVELGRKAQAAGISVRPDMLTNSKVARMLGDILEKPYFSGGKATQRQEQFNQAVIETIGGDSTKNRLTSDVFAKAINKWGETIGDISGESNIPLKGQLDSKLSALSSATEFETSDVAKIVNKYVAEIKSKVGTDGQIDGETFRKIRTKLVGQMRRTKDGDLKYALSNIDDAMLDAIEGQLTPEKFKLFGKARRYYRNAKTIEPLVAKGTGDISPQGLMGRVTATGQGKSSMARGTAGDLGDLARIGQAFLGSTGSTAQNLAIGAGEATALMNAFIPTAGALGGANLYNRVIAPGLANRILRPPTP